MFYPLLGVLSLINGYYDWDLTLLWDGLCLFPMTRNVNRTLMSFIICFCITFSPSEVIEFNSFWDLVCPFLGLMRAYIPIMIGQSLDIELVIVFECLRVITSFRHSFALLGGFCFSSIFDVFHRGLMVLILIVTEFIMS